MATSPAVTVRSLPMPFEVPAVFLRDSADLWIKSNDDEYFKVHKEVLAMASGFWENSFETVGVASGGGTRDSALLWDEPATVIIGLLYQVYPIAKPELNNVEELIALVLAADKWLMDGIQVHLLSHLLSPRFLDKRPMAIYTAACGRSTLLDIKRASARRLVELFDPLEPGFYADTAGLWAQNFIDLVTLRRRRIEYALQVFDKHFPNECQHGYDLGYGDWKTASRDALPRSPSARSLLLLSMIPGLLRGGIPDCYDGGCEFRATSCLERVETVCAILSDTDRFIGDDTYFESIPDSLDPLTMSFCSFYLLSASEHMTIVSLQGTLVVALAKHGSTYRGK